LQVLLVREFESSQLEDEESLHPANSEPESTNVTAAERFRFTEGIHNTPSVAVSYKNEAFFDLCTADTGETLQARRLQEIHRP
jgi:hypothetical protein